MQQKTFFEELTVSFPDDFQVMNRQDRIKYFGTDAGNQAIRHTERHLLIAFFKTKPSVFSRLTDAKSVANGWHLRYSKSLPQYNFVGHLKTALCGKKAEGFDFTFKAVDADVIQNGRMLVFRQKSYFYLIVCYGSNTAEPDNIQLRDEILNSLHLIP